MAYIGKTPSSGIRNRFIYTATAGQTTFSGTDDHSRTLSYTDAEFTDVFLNGVKLDKSDYTATSGTSIVLDEGAAVDDILEVLAFDTFSVFSGEFSQDVTVGGATTLSGDLTVDTDTLYVDSTNNRVGVGTSSAYGTNVLNVNGGIAIDGRNASTPGLCEKSDTNTGIFWPASDALAVTTGGTERMRIDSSGNVTLGAGGTYRLDINAPTSSAAKITCDNTAMEIGTFDNHVVKFLSNNTERMRIDSNGNMGLGTTNTPSCKLRVQGGSSSTSTPVCEIIDGDTTVEGGSTLLKLNFGADNAFSEANFVLFSDVAGTQGEIRGSGDGSVTYDTTSDQRLKQNIIDTGSKWDVIKALQVRDYEWKRTGNSKTGFIAQELYTQIPQVVKQGGSDENDDPWMVGYGDLTPFLTKALQEAITKIETLETKVAALEASD